MERVCTRKEAVESSHTLAKAGTRCPGVAGQPARQSLSTTAITSTTGPTLSLSHRRVLALSKRQGGPVIHEIADLDTNRAAIIAVVDGIVADGFTPVSETLYEAALYWRGENAHYGELVNEHTPEVYKGPVSDACAKNYNVLLTDGAPTDDVETHTLVTNLPNWFATLNRTDCTGTGLDGECTDDIAEYLFKNDISSTEPGDQLVTTHTIGFSINLPILAETAAVSEGGYFLADDVESLSLALMKIFTKINEESLSFAAPAVAVNSFNRTQNFNDLYLTAFNASEKTHWPGNLKKYRISSGAIVDSNDALAVDPTTGFFKDAAQSFWSVTADGNNVEAGGAASQIPDPSVRWPLQTVSPRPIPAHLRSPTLALRGLPVSQPWTS